MNEFAILVPAREGSKRLPGKNLKHLGGKSLLQRTAEFAREGARGIPVYLSTDSPAIAEQGRLNGWEVPFLRPSHLATDQATSVSVALHFLDYMAQHGVEPKNLVLLQPTSPFRRPALLSEAINKMISDSSIPAIVAMKDLNRSPMNTFTTDDEGRAKSLSFDRRSLLTPNGSLYAIQVSVLKEKQTFAPDGLLPIVLGDVDSIDIDTAFDWQIAESVVSEWDKNNG